MKVFGAAHWFLILIALSLGVKMLASLRLVPESGALAIVSTLDPEEVEWVAICRSNGESNLAERVSSDSWRLSAPFRAELESGGVMKMLDRLMLSRPGDVLSASDMRRMGLSPRDFGFGQSNLTVRAGTALAQCEFCFGGFTPLHDEVYLMSSESGSIFTVSTNVLASVPANVDAWRRRRIFSARAALVTAMEVRMPEMPFVQLSRALGAWRIVQPQSAPADQAAVEETLLRLLALEAESFVYPAALSSAPAAGLPGDRVSAERLAAYGLGGQEGFAVSLWTSPTSVERIVFGQSAGTNSVYALVHDAAAVVRVNAEIVEFCRARRGQFLDTRIFPFAASAVRSISLTLGDAVYVVVRTDSGEWRLESPVSAPADESTLSELLAGVLSLSQNDRAVPGAGRQTAVVKVTLSGGGNQPASVVVPAALLPAPTSLRSKKVFSVPASSVRRLTVSSAGGETVVERDSESARFRLVKTPAAASAITVSARTEGIAEVLAALSEVNATSVENLNAASEDFKRCGLVRPAFTIAVDVEAADAVRRNLLLGAASSGGGRYATAGGADAIFILPGDVVARLTTPLTKSELEVSGAKSEKTEK